MFKAESGQYIPVEWSEKKTLTSSFPVKKCVTASIALRIIPQLKAPLILLLRMLIYIGMLFNC